MRRLSLVAVIALVATLAVFVSPAPRSVASIVTCNGLLATIIGAGVINGTSGPDVIVGSDGPDTIKGNGGNDVICGRNGDDKINGNSGNDQIFSIGPDFAPAGANVDILAGDAGDDSLSLVHSSVDSIATGGTGNDAFFGSSALISCLDFVCTAKPRYDGGAGSDFFDVIGGHLLGGSGDDTLIGGGLLEGGSGDDVLAGRFNFPAEYRGGSGDDTISGSIVNSERLNGGSGFDSCANQADDQLISCEVTF